MKMYRSIASLSLFASVSVAPRTASGFVTLLPSGSHSFSHASASRKRRRFQSISSPPFFVPQSPPSSSSSSSSSFVTFCSPDALDEKDGTISGESTRRISPNDVRGSDSNRNPQHVSQTFILIDTKHPGNVGAAARAMKTMGFGNLILVTPHDDRVLGRKKCIDGASGALDVLRNATVVNSLEEALQSISIVDKDFNHEGEGDDDGDGDGDGENVASQSNSHNVIVCGTGMPVDMQNDRPKVSKYAAPRHYFQQIVRPPRDTHTHSHAHSHTYTLEDDPKDADAIHVAFVFGNERYGMKGEDIDKCQVMLGIPTNPAFGSLNLASAVQLIAYDWREAIGGFGPSSPVN